MTNANEPAYPRTGWMPTREDVKQMHQTHLEAVMTLPTKGMTKREIFAAMAMQGIMASSQGWPDGNPQHMEEAARRAVNAADALIKQLNSTDK